MNTAQWLEANRENLAGYLGVPVLPRSDADPAEVLAELKRLGQIRRCDVRQPYTTIPRRLS